MDDVVLWGIVMAFTAVAHLAALFSLYVRWGTVPLAAAAVWLPFIGFMMILQPSGTTENEIGTLMVLGYGAVCAACHALIGHRLAELAAA
jgi:hypothetical protein